MMPPAAYSTIVHATTESIFSSTSSSKSPQPTAFCLSKPRPLRLVQRCTILHSKARCYAAPGRTAGIKRQRRSPLRCGLTRLSSDAANKVLPGLATRDQWTNYWGDTDIQRVGKAFEVSAVAFLGLWACYFTSFFLGVGTTSIIGGSFLFYWLLAPNVTAFRRNRALRGTIAPFRGGPGNSAALFSARVTSATEEYHPITGQPVFLCLVIEDEDGRALKFRTRNKMEYARLRTGMVAEAVLVSPNEGFEDIIGVSDTFVPAANVWVGEYPYLDKAVMRRLLASRDAKKRRRDDDELYSMTYRDAWTQTYAGEDAEVEGSEDLASGMDTPEACSDDADGNDDGEHLYEGWGSAGFSAIAEDGLGRRAQQWERVSGKPRPRRRLPTAARQPAETEAFADLRRTSERSDARDESLWRGANSRETSATARQDFRGGR